MRSLVLVKVEDRGRPEEYESVKRIARAILDYLRREGMEALTKKFGVQESYILVAVGVL